MFDYLKNRKKILGMNSRYLQYIRPNNLKRAIKIADDKLLSKKILQKNKIPVPKLITKITSHEELESFDWDKLPNSFALKPNKGLGGAGILVVFGKKKNREDAWVKADRKIVTIEDFKSHIRNILDGNFSLSGVPDIAFFEERLTLLKLFKPYSFRGIPDIRVIVYNRVPIMAMLRLPTKESRGKANLQQGGIGVGIDLATGITTTAVQGKKSKIIEDVPDTRLSVSGLKIPFWREILELAISAQDVSGLGFLGADVAIDKERGPVFLELNARAGLSIQIANLAGLQERMERVNGLKIKTIKRGVNVGMDLFGGDVEEELEEISGKKVIGFREKIKITGRNGKEIEVSAKIDTGAYTSSIDEGLAKKLGFEKTVNEFNAIGKTYKELKNLNKSERWRIYKNSPYLVSTVMVTSSHGTTYRPIIKVNFIMDGRPVVAKMTVIDRSHLKHRIIIGRRNLGRFMIDVGKISKFNI